MDWQEASNSVALYRSKMHSVCALWNNLQRKMHIAYSRGEEFVLQLPSGRELNYGKIYTTLQDGRRNYVAKLTKGSKKVPIRLWGGLLAENFSQALARDIFANMLVEIEKQGIEILFHVHDEFIIETDKNKAEETLEAVLKCMSEAPDWITDIPLGAEGKVVARYEK